MNASSQSWVILCVVLLAPFGCKCKPDAQPSAAAVAASDAPITLTGAGESFFSPLYSKWIAEYGKLNPRVQINYQSTDLTSDIRQVAEGTVDFGTTGAPLTQAELSVAIVHVPTALGAVVVAYNLAGVLELKLSPDALAGIYLGTIKRWNDAKIAADNPGVELPSAAVNAVFRSDGNGTTGVFTDYLSKVNKEFSDKVGRGKLVSWATGVGAKGSEGVIGQVKSTPGAIGYLDLAQATENEMSLAAIGNKAGEFVKANSETISLAAESVPLAESLTASIVAPSAVGAYPISAYTYVVVPERSANTDKGNALGEFLSWAVHTGQQHATALHYAALPPAAVELVSKRISALRSGAGQPLAK